MSLCLRVLRDTLLQVQARGLWLEQGSEFDCNLQLVNEQYHYRTRQGTLLGDDQEVTLTVTGS